MSAGATPSKAAAGTRGAAIPRAPAPHGHSEFVLLVIATDGVWDVLPSPAIMATAAQCMALTHDPVQAALAVTRAASTHGSVDDISAIVVWFP